MTMEHMTNFVKDDIQSQSDQSDSQITVGNFSLFPTTFRFNHHFYLEFKCLVSIPPKRRLKGM